MLSLLIIIFLLLVVVSVILTDEGPHHTKSTYTQVKSDIFTRRLSHHVRPMSIHKSIFTRGLHTVERSLTNPWFITGLVDAEGSFIVHIVKDDSRKLGYFVLVSFELALNVKDRLLLDLLQETMGNFGNIYYNPQDDTYKYKVSNIEGLINFVIPHFQKYPLLTQKRADYELFKLIITKMERGEHLTSSGLLEIINIRASINLGLSPGLKAAFPHHIPVARPLVEITEIPHPQWVVGFTSGEGCFYVVTSPSVTSKVGFSVRLRFIISRSPTVVRSATQHSRDANLINSFVEYLGCGRIRVEEGRSIVHFQVSGFTELTNNVLPIFTQCSLHGIKALNLGDFCKAVSIIQSKDHLTKAGMEEILKLKAGMNRGRK